MTANVKSCHLCTYYLISPPPKLPLLGFDFNMFMSVLTCNRRKISGNWWVILVFLVDLGDHLNISAVVTQDSLVFLCNSQVWEVQPLKSSQQSDGPGRVSDTLKLLVHKLTDLFLSQKEKAYYIKKKNISYK